MPQVPIPEYSQFPKLRKLEGELERRTELYIDKKAIDWQLAEINKPLFIKLRSVLPPDVKSFDFPFASVSGNGEEQHFQISPIQQSARKTFKRERLLNTTFACPHCCKHLTVPAAVVDKAYATGKLPEPTVSVKLIGEEGEDREGDNE